MQLCALPIGIAACLAVAALWICLTPVENITISSPFALLISMLVIIPIHELLHLAVHPRSKIETDSVLGFWPATLMFYAHFHGELARNRFLLILAMPTLVISLLSLFICAVFQIAPPLLAFISTINALFACGDFFAMALIIFQVPAHAMVRNQQYRTYWKPVSELA